MASRLKDGDGRCHPKWVVCYKEIDAEVLWEYDHGKNRGNGDSSETAIGHDVLRHSCLILVV